MKMKNNGNSYLNKEIKEKIELKSLGSIIQEYLSYFKTEEVINLFFSLKEDENTSINNKKKFNQNPLTRADKNTTFQLKIFLEVLRENYGDQCIINELYKYIVNKNKKDSSKKIGKKNDKNHRNDECKKFTNNNLLNSFDKKDYIFILNKENKQKELSKDFIKIDRSSNNWIISTKSKCLDMFLNKNEITKKIIGYLYKMNSNNIFLYYPMIEQNLFIKDKNLKKIKENDNKLFFVCELYINERESNRCNSYGLYDLNSMNFSVGAPHTKSINEHPHSLIPKNEDSISEKDELMEIIVYFSKMDIKGALIINENL
jgi:hypothetical protein